MRPATPPDPRPPISLAPWATFLFAPRTASPQTRTNAPRNPLHLLDALVFLLYAIILTIAIHHHLASDDESQAWLLARDNTLHDLVFRRLHYEGAPALWPILLWIAARLHMTVNGISWLGGAFALAGTAILLRYAPFPRIFRWLLPFTFFLQYQYAVIARPYVLAPALLFTLCILYSLPRPRPILFALVAGALVNVSLHTAIIAGIFALLYLRNLYQSPIHPPPTRRTIAAALAVFFSLSLISAVVAIPAPDVTIVNVNLSDDTPTAHPFLSKFIPPEQLPPGAPALDPVLSAVQPNPAVASAPKLLVTIVKTIILGADAACYPIARSNLLAVLFLATVLIWLRNRRALALALPWILSILLSVQIFVFDHHTGLFALALIAALWITLDQPTPAATLNTASRTGIALSALALLVILLQIQWTARTIHTEASHPYDPGRATEQFLTEHFPHSRIAGFDYESVSTQAQAPHNLFFNQPHAYWLWSAPVFIDRRRTEALNQHPDVVVIGDLLPGTELLFNQWTPRPATGSHMLLPMRTYWEQHGYHVTHRFCGDRLVRGGVSDTFCELILQPNATP